MIKGTVQTTTVKLKVRCRHCDGDGKIKQSEHVLETCWSCDGRRSEEYEMPLVDFLVSAGVVFHDDQPRRDAAFPPEEDPW